MIIHQVSTSGYGAVEHSPEDLRWLVTTLEQAILAGEQVEMPVVHKFAHGLYVREILVKKGWELTGRLHKQDDFQIVYYGDISILTEQGLKRFVGPCSFTSKAGIKPYAYAHEDTLYSTVHHTHLTDLAAIERELFEDEPHAIDFVTGKVLQEVVSCQPR